MRHATRERVTIGTSVLMLGAGMILGILIGLQPCGG